MPLDGDEDINITSEELAELLADGPIVAKKSVIGATKAITNDDDDDEGDYGLGTWV